MSHLDMVVLNLLRNNLTGLITPVKQLQSLYFPGNQSSSIIPATKSDLTFVAYLAFSYNNLLLDYN
ncbi:hypothetical protein SADUNF_Sadunf12G0022300 [Salix dunnii]|uniref:Uncharacterized protein n=1 Tax=Salix dunnii TaxID=1413687 RepID=A0A835MRY2_9ROSI|nr:hypothetical protein SADUNF_Sadunf12G0022300 [Salix dunnii]